MRICDRCEVPIYPCPTGPVLVGDPPRQMPMMWCEGWLHRGGWHRCYWPGGVYGESATPRDPFADVTVWFPGEGPVPIAGECPHYTCMHSQQAVIGWGPDQLRYQVIRCDASLGAGGCAGECRVMVNVANVWSSPWWFTAWEMKEDGPLGGGRPLQGLQGYLCGRCLIGRFSNLHDSW